MAQLSSAFLYILSAFLQAQIAIGTIDVKDDFEMMIFSALQGARNEFTNTTVVLTLFREKPQNVMKKRKNLTRKHIFDV